MEVYLSDFGADPKGIHESGPALHRALSYIKTLKRPCKLIFEQGVYRITKEFAPVRNVHTSNTDSLEYPNKKIGFLIESISDLTIDGQGSKIWFEGDMMALAILQSSNIRIKNLAWDFKVPTTSEMRVIDFDNEEKWIDYQIPSMMPYQIEGTQLRWLSEKDSKGQYYWTEVNAHQNYGIQVHYPQIEMGRSYYSEQNPFEGIIKIEELKSHCLRFHYHKMPPVKSVVGMNYQFVSNAKRPTAGAFVWESQDIFLDNMQISYMHGFGFLVQMSENIFFNKISFQSNRETGRDTASYADGIHVSGAKGKVQISNCIFDNTHDDPINIHGTFTRIEEKIDEKSMKLTYVHPQQGGFPQFYPGDQVIFYSRDQLQGFKNEKRYHVEEAKLCSDLRTMYLRFQEKLEDDLFDKDENGEGLYVAENVSYTPEVLIQNNVFKNVFTRSILLTSRKKAMIVNNVFYGSTMATLFFSNDSNDWYESGPIRDLEIRGNIFYVRSIGRTWWKNAPAIYFYPVTKGGHLPSSEKAIHRNILIEGNSFYLESDAALRAESVQNLIFRNNKLYRLTNEDLKTNKERFISTEILKMDPKGPENSSPSQGEILSFKACDKIIIEANQYDEDLKGVILIEEMEQKSLQNKDDLDLIKINNT